jgi:glycosyltransferase involved in cell wall biosynthesis
LVGLILFITRKYPPSVGGMQNLSYRLTTRIAGRRDARIIAWGGSQRYLPFFIVVAFFRALANGLVYGVDLIHLGDPALGALGLVLGGIFRVPVVVTVHGLDVVYPNRLYQWVTSRVLRRLDRIVAISNAAQTECLKRGARLDRCSVVTIGVDPPPIVLPTRAEARDRLTASYGLTLVGRDVLLTTGRLVRRKGVAWFVDEVLPKIVKVRPETVYLVVGVGPEEARIRAAIEQRRMMGHVRLLGKVSNATLWDAYRACDLFVMPNIRVKGDLEGFGLVAIEAGLAERFVVASDLEGIRDAIIPSKNGALVSPDDSAAFSRAIANQLANRPGLDELGVSARAFAIDRFSWPRIVDDYLRIFDSLTRPIATE